MEFGMFGFYFWFCPLPKNHLLCLSCVWLVVPYLRGLIVTTSLLQTDLRSVCTASPADSSTGSLSVVCCSALLTWELKSPACCLSSSLSLGLFGSIRALLQELEDVCPSLLWPPSRASLGSKRMDRLEPWMPSWRVLTPCSCSTRAACSRASLWQKTLTAPVGCAGCSPFLSSQVSHGAGNFLGAHAAIQWHQGRLFFFIYFWGGEFSADLLWVSTWHVALCILKLCMGQRST